MNDNKPEIMSPAGCWISLRAALDAGCDAVYFGIKGANMRAGADNFSAGEMKKLAKQCHDAGVKAYLALNTVLYENDISNTKKIICKSKEADIDAIICWDFAVIQEAVKQQLPVYASTQMSVANSESILFLHNSFGINRFVLARECSLSDIKTIRRKLKKARGIYAKDIEIEVFVHGAMCVSISGRCFMSHFLTGKSANRGECLQPCRREYFVTEKDREYSLVLGSNYILSPEDLCALPFIEKLIEAGVSSLKIEGRNRSPEYVRTVTGAYRKAVDFYFENRKKKEFKKQFKTLKAGLVNQLRTVYNRGFSSGFFLGRPADQWTSTYGSQATKKKEYSGIVIKYYRKPGVAEVRVESNEFRNGDEIMFHGPTTGVLAQVAESIEINHKKIDLAEKGTVVAVKTTNPVRPNDRVYVVK